MEPVVQAKSDSGDHAEMLRSERDRFVAFAFCTADLLLETDAKHNITFCAGAAQSLIGIPPEK